LIPAAAIVVAAGVGRRMGGEAKQVRLLDGRPTLCWAMRPFLEALAGPLVLVVSQEAAAEAEALARRHLGPAADRVHVVAGGERRQDSVRAGLAALATLSGVTETVLVHDGVRPFASRGLVEQVASRAVGGRAVIPALPIADTLKETEGERVVTTRDRSRYVMAQTPQGFPRAILEAAFEAADSADATDCSALCERLGAPVHWIPGEPLNRKLTDPEDWAWAELTVAAGWVRWEEP
jgi:2-C-methyl-D-erythritol 4-phosphate cytidylyltransferase